MGHIPHPTSRSTRSAASALARSALRAHIPHTNEGHPDRGPRHARRQGRRGRGQERLRPELPHPAPPRRARHRRARVKRYAEETRQASHKIEAQRASLQALAQKLDGTEVTISTRSGEDGRLFGTITTQQIAEALAAAGTDVDRRKISLEGDIRETGDYPATVRMGADATATVTVHVVSENAPAAPARPAADDTSDEVSSYEDTDDDDD